MNADAAPQIANGQTAPLHGKAITAGPFQSELNLSQFNSPELRAISPLVNCLKLNFALNLQVQIELLQPLLKQEANEVLATRYRAFHQQVAQRLLQDSGMDQAAEDLRSVDTVELALSNPHLIRFFLLRTLSLTTPGESPPTFLKETRPPGQLNLQSQFINEWKHTYREVWNIFFNALGVVAQSATAQEQALAPTVSGISDCFDRLQTRLLRDERIRKALLQRE